ncbi:import inner membrane translocase subunit tim22 [Anaeramoeba ignava]|uniref:Mitochondrial import inner membrane translocase subunit TIM22 n=1 Tax=Anaeramoeba ignava TaxID=1746090 RepID=A0A9Q0LNV4_ANAIG|nr:import inner membrane translocase subunit tim22 [Anaeramoeba ignava]
MSLLKPQTLQEILISQIEDNLKSSHEKLERSCLFQSLKGGINGATSGFVFGVILNLIQSEELNISWLSEGLTFAKTGAISGSLYNLFKCNLENYRDKKDLINSAVCGCAVGAVLGAKNGPKTSLLSCGLGSIFSTISDYFSDFF